MKRLFLDWLLFLRLAFVLVIVFAVLPAVMGSGVAWTVSLLTERRFLVVPVGVFTGLVVFVSFMILLNHREKEAKRFCRWLLERG